jgi:hypothetical protein
MKKDFGAIPDPETHPPATAVTPQQIRDSEAAVLAARTPEGRATAEAAHRELCNSQNDQLRQVHLQRELQRFGQ